MVTLTIWGIVSVSLINVFSGACLGYQAGKESIKDNWKFCNDELPPDFGRVIINYPVAFYYDDFGVIVDQAEYHPNRPGKWFLVPSGEVCRPFAWFDLPYAPLPDAPQDIVKNGRL